MLLNTKRVLRLLIMFLGIVILYLPLTLHADDLLEIRNMSDKVLRVAQKNSPELSCHINSDIYISSGSNSVFRASVPTEPLKAAVCKVDVSYKEYKFSISLVQRPLRPSTLRVITTKNNEGGNVCNNKKFGDDLTCCMDIQGHRYIVSFLNTNKYCN